MTSTRLLYSAWNGVRGDLRAHLATLRPAALTALAVLVGWLASASLAVSSASAQPAEVPPAESRSQAQAQAAKLRALEHERIRRERDTLAQQRKTDEAACYQRFAVEECLRGVRSQVRDAQTRLREQEFQLNDAQRKERAEERLRLIEEKRKAPPQLSPKVPGVPQSSLRGAPREVAQPVAPRVPQAKASEEQRAREAQVRAQEQRQKVQAHAEHQAARSAELHQRAEQARLRQETLVQAAQARRERVEAQQADALAAGRTPAAALPRSSAPIR